MSKIKFKLGDTVRLKEVPQNLSSVWNKPFLPIDVQFDSTVQIGHTSTITYFINPEYVVLNNSTWIYPLKCLTKVKKAGRTNKHRRVVDNKKG